MITYEPLWNTMYLNDVTTYELIKKHRFSSGTLNRLKNNKPTSTTTINRLCKIFACDVSEVLEYIPDKQES